MYQSLYSHLWSTAVGFLRSSAPLRSFSLSPGYGSLLRQGSKVNTGEFVSSSRYQTICSVCSRRLLSYRGTTAIVRRMTHSYSKSSPPSSSSSSRRNLLLYGLVAFLWERERISNDEILRCVQQYEERLAHSSATLAHTPGPSSSELDKTSTQSELSGKSAQHDKQEFITELVAHYQSHSNDKVDSFPLVGMKPKTPRSYVVSNLVVERFKASAVHVVGRVRDMVVKMNPTRPDLYASERSGCEATFNDCFKTISDLACIGVTFETQESVYHANNGHFGDWFMYILTNQERSQLNYRSQKQTHLYPLVGLRERKKSVVNKLIERFSTPKVIKTLRSLDFVQMFDNVLGVDTRFSNALSSVVQETRHALSVTAVRLLDRSLEVLQSAGYVRSVGGASVRSEACDVDKRQAGDQLPTPSEDWELFVEEKRCTAYRKSFEDTGLYQFKVIGRYHDITAKDFYDVQVDKEARQTWDAYATSLQVIDRDPQSSTEVVHWVMKFPFPMSSREYVFVRKGWVSPDHHTIVLKSRSVNHPAVPESGNSVRIGAYFSEMVIKAHTHVEEPGFDFELTYFDDPKVYLPSSCVNWVTTTAMPDFLSKIHKAAASRLQSPAVPTTGAAHLAHQAI